MRSCQISVPRLLSVLKFQTAISLQINFWISDDFFSLKLSTTEISIFASRLGFSQHVTNEVTGHWLGLFENELVRPFEWVPCELKFESQPLGVVSLSLHLSCISKYSKLLQIVPPSARANFMYYYSKVDSIISLQSCEKSLNFSHNWNFTSKYLKQRSVHSHFPQLLSCTHCIFEGDPFKSFFLLGY